MSFAFDEFRTLTSSLSSPSDEQDKTLWYLASLMAELCYYHVADLELDNKRRAKIIPCEAYQQILLRGVQTSIIEYLRGAELGRVFIIVDRGVIAVGIHVGNRLFIGFRGTLFLYAPDWGINLRARLVSLDPGFIFRPSSVHGVGIGRFHQGFTEEAVRIAVRIWREIANWPNKEFQEVILSGHSLGGAVAAICEPLLWGLSREFRTVILGAPRYCDVTAQYSRPGRFPIEIKRSGDMVPSIPPRSLGYADCPWEFTTSGEPVIDSVQDGSWNHILWRWSLFTGKRFEPHDIDGYRRELGTSCGAKLASEPLLDAMKISASTVGADQA